MQEIWLPVCHKDYSDRYMISNFGRVKSLRKASGKVKNSSNGNEFMSLNNHSAGYKYVTFFCNGKRENFFVHRLVAEAFIPNPYNLPQVNHIDGNKQNNLASNLEWCTAKENIIHAVNTGLFNPSKHRVAHHPRLKTSTRKSRIVYQFSMDGKLIKKWRCALDASKELKIPNNKIYMCCNHKISYTNGFIFSYENFVEPVLKSPKSKNGFSKSRQTKTHRLVHPVKQCDLSGNLINTFKDLTTASEQTGVSKTGISLCCTGKRRQSNGFIWEYADV